MTTEARLELAMKAGAKEALRAIDSRCSFRIGDPLRGAYIRGFRRAVDLYEEPTLPERAEAPEEPAPEPEPEAPAVDGEETVEPLEDEVDVDSDEDPDA